MVFDKIQVNGQEFITDGRFSLDEELLKVSTVNGEVGLLFKQIEAKNETVEIVLSKGDTDRYHSKDLKLTHYTVAGGDFKMELQK
ncbi:hypothetical protein [Macrococcoides caseolyticum]|uniref:hypothetical protein n=1 Tax=Macrococcoides caseolyticum TaxID=69966 RepID=UPI001F265B78|nr:hypothetical protein [Macrococcus caseolyticus]MCE4957234.1 hypothetical protein [Macrococcus caseolyticus]